MYWWTGLNPVTAVQGLLAGAPVWIIFLVPGVLAAVALIVLSLGSQIAMVFLERRILGRFQIRIGPNRAGPEGTLQLIADAFKAMGKEIVLPRLADRQMYFLAPLLALIPAFLSLAVLPFGPDQIGLNIPLSLIFFEAVSSLSAIVIFIGGWASYNKFAVFGAMRAVAQFVSYEIPLVLSTISVALLTGSLSTLQIANQQANVPFIAILPLAAGIFAIASIAEINRTPMDTVEAESEIVAGYHTEYGGMPWLMMYGAEYLHMLAFGGMLSTLFLGGWRFFWLETVIPPWILFIVKMYLVFFVLVWLRATLPRVRIDQLMNLGWKTLTPLALVSLLLTAGGLLAGDLGWVVVALLQWVAIGVLVVLAASRSGRRQRATREQYLAAQQAAVAR